MTGSRNPKPTSSVDLRALTYIRNELMHGRSPSVRDLASALGYKSPRSASLVLERLMANGYLARRSDGRLQLLRTLADDDAHARTVEVPLVGCAPCGTPILAEENVEAMISVSTRLARPPHRYFLLRAIGDSMNEVGIEDGALVLVRQQQAADNGDLVVALIDDEATIKEFCHTDRTVALRPRSTNPVHKPIILTRDFLVQGVVVASLADVIG